MHTALSRSATGHSDDLDNVDWPCIKSDCQASRIKVNSSDITDHFQIHSTLESGESLWDDSRGTHFHSRPDVTLLWPFSDCKSEICPTPSRSLLVDEEFTSWNSDVSTSLNSVSNVQESLQIHASHSTVNSDLERSCDYSVSDCTKELCTPHRKQGTSSFGHSNLAQSQIFKRSTRFLSTQLNKSSTVTSTDTNNKGFSSGLGNNTFPGGLFVEHQNEQFTHSNLLDETPCQISQDLGNDYTRALSRLRRTDGLRVTTYKKRSSALGKRRGESSGRRTERMDERNTTKTTYRCLQARCSLYDFSKINKDYQITRQEEQVDKSVSGNNTITDSSTLGIVNYIHGRRRHLLQFIMKILDERHPCVKWVDKDKRAFHISVPDDLARLWGEYKKNNRMTFTSLTRSLRLYCTSGKLERLPGRHHHYRLLCSGEEMQSDMDQS
ncbi:hypothetical protein P879_09569 [Paragonimus westermani]|uniref:ETS domain-containing protein n=1 Tax=Paragonimus westermani TaxID=34504 RepID=A0A8T0DJ12_9TREM|nr:hypothetical protein P879_09569 [Paragonimus westermani]